LYFIFCNLIFWSPLMAPKLWRIIIASCGQPDGSKVELARHYIIYVIPINKSVWLRSSRRTIPLLLCLESQGETLLATEKVFISHRRANSLYIKFNQRKTWCFFNTTLYLMIIMILFKTLNVCESDSSFYPRDEFF
jgi:hypothetical protein